MDPLDGRKGFRRGHEDPVGAPQQHRNGRDVIRVLVGERHGLHQAKVPFQRCQPRTDLLRRCHSSRLRTVVLAHLSEQNNDPDLARFAAEEVLRGSGTQLYVARQKDPLELADNP